MTDERQIDDTTVMEKDGSGNLVIKNIDEATISKLAAALDANGNDITDSGTTVYDASSKTVGDGTTDANHSSVNTEKLTYKSEPTGSLVQLSGNQDIANSTGENIAWADGTRDPDNLLDATNNEVVVPSGFSYAKISISVQWDTDTDLNLLQARINGNAGLGAPSWFFGNSSLTLREFTLSPSPWVSVSSGDSITARTIQTTGSTQTLLDSGKTYMEVWLV